MSGIAGIIHFDGAPVEPGLVERMTAAMANRGPDGINHWVRGSVALGQCMLRTTPESLDENQPLANEDQSLVMVMDGRVDNWEELRKELLGRRAILRNRADAELVLRAYEIWGRDCLSHIDGDFALAIWDAQRRVVFCARDRMGSKPFHYHWSGSSLVFASELHPILALPWVARVPNEGMLAEFLAAEWHSRDETLWSGILRLVGAHCMEVCNRGPRPEQYWEPDLWRKLPYNKVEDYVEHYRELLSSSVRRRSRSHRPVAVEVSGGLDSSAVFCMAEHLSRAGRLLAPGVEGYTLAFTGNDEANELSYARAVGEYLSVPIHEVAPFLPPLLWFAEHARDYQEFPGFPNASMFLGMRQQAVSAGARVFLTGEGGDEWQAGTREYYAEELSQHHWTALYDCLKADANHFGAWQAMKWLIRYGCFPLLPSAMRLVLHRLARRIRGGETGAALYWLSPRMRELIHLRRRRSFPLGNRSVRIHGQRELLATPYDAFNTKTLERVERESARCGIEIRNPLYDLRLVQFAFSTPERLRLNGDTTKLLHRLALKNMMPAAVLERKSKAGFDRVFRVQLDQMKEMLTRTYPRERSEWFIPEGVARLYQTYDRNRELGWPLWLLWAIYGCGQVLPRQ